MKARILKRLEDEVAQLERELRSELPKEIQRARELGDLSENAEYQAAKERQSYVHARVGMIRKRMAEISLMNLDRLPTDRAAFGSTVKLREDGNGTLVSYQLVMPEDADATKGLISTSSPIGKAIVGKQEGDDITVPTPTGVRRFELISLSTIHDE
jgi:transcription elongation factor GreA